MITVNLRSTPSQIDPQGIRIAFVPAIALHTPHATVLEDGSLPGFRNGVPPRLGLPESCWGYPKIPWLFFMEHLLEMDEPPKLSKLLE